MRFWVLVAFAIGWVVGQMTMKAVRALQQTDIVGILAECAAAWYRTHRAEYHLPSPKALSTIVGMGLCSLAAGVACLFGGSRYDALFPLAFLLLIVGCARYFGPLAGFLGAVSAAGIFAWFLYAPAGFAVEDRIAQTTLIMMVLVSIIYWIMSITREHRAMRTAHSTRS